MLTRPQVQRYAAESGLRDIMIAEKEVVLTYMLQLLSAHGHLNQLAFKGGTCLRKMFVGSQGRFSTDLDFTSLQEHDHEDIALSSCCPALYESGLKTENLKSRPNIEVEYRFGEGARFPRS
jgi:predicted nucleotidyltransferase component of viral defense system